MGDGIGRMAADFMNALGDEVSMCFCLTRKHVNLSDVPKKIHPLIKHRINRRQILHSKVLIYYDALPKLGKPNKYINQLGAKNFDQIRIAYSMVESSRIPEHWVDILNRQFDAVAVPDEYLVEVYKLSGVNIPIFFLPLGLDIEPFLQQPLKASYHTPFCFINTSSLTDRKNHDCLIKAFHKAFADHPEVQLLMNYRYAAKDTLDRTTQLIASLNAKNIILKGDKLDNQQYLQFLLKGDAFVTLSKGEGYSIQPREAMALGLPIIISDNTAHKTLIKSNLVCAVSTVATEPAYVPFLRCFCGEAYLSDVDEAAAQLRDVYDNYDKHLTLAAERREWVKCACFENLKPLYLSLVNPKKMVLAEHNAITTGGLITNSEELYQKYIRLFNIQACASL